jgi:monoamine oxidase
MARSALMDSLKRIAEDHAIADRLGITVEELHERRKSEPRPSRRAFLAGAGAVAALAAMPRRARAASQPRIAIVGGGIAGVSAAMTLADAGYTATVYEAQNRIGGRMHSNTTTWQNGQVSEWCGELIDTGHKTILHLANMFGLSVVDMIQTQPQGSTDTLYFFGQYYSTKQAASDFSPVYKIIKAQTNDTSYPTLYNHYTQAGWNLDHVSVYDWIEQYVPGGHGSPLGAYIDSAYCNEYGLDTNQQSSLNMLYLLAYQPTPGNMQIYGASDERYHIVGGNEQLPRAIAASLPGAVNTGWKMTKIAQNTDGSFTLTFAVGKTTQTVTADRVIMTIPFSVLRGLDYSHAGFDTLKTTAITQLGYGTNSKLATQFNTRYWNSTGPWGSGDGNIYTDLSFQNTWDSTRGQPGAQGILAAFNGGTPGLAYAPPGPYTQASDSSKVAGYAQALMGQLEQVWPGVSAQWNGLATLSCPWMDPNQLGSYSCWKVGQYTLFSGYEKARQGRCHFAGEHCSQDFQGYMEGGASEGIRAANEILSDYKVGVFP